MFSRGEGKGCTFHIDIPVQMQIPPSIDDDYPLSPDGDGGRNDGDGDDRDDNDDDQNNGAQNHEAGQGEGENDDGHHDHANASTATRRYPHSEITNNVVEIIN